MAFSTTINPFAGKLQYVLDPTLVTWKPGVADAANLPASGNSDGDARLTNDDGHLHIWDADTSTWTDQGDILDLTWAAITGKPSSSTADIDDAVTNKHVQNTDTQLDSGVLEIDGSDNVVLSVGKILSSNSGVITLGGTGGTNNEDLILDFETVANTVGIDSNTGVAVVSLNMDIRLNDLKSVRLGSSDDCKILWQVEGNDSVQIATRVNGADGSGYISIIDLDSIGNVNRSPSGTSANPVLRIYSSDETEANDYIEFYHDQSSAIIASGKGQMIFDSASSFSLDAGNGTIVFKNSGSTGFGYYVDTAYDQLIIYLLSVTGRQLILTDGGNYNKDHDHVTTTDPTLFIHSSTDPDTDNSEWISFTHNQTDGVIDVGKGVLSILDSIKVTGDINPEADGTRDLGTQTTAQWANVWSDLINGADYSFLNKWRLLESEKYEDYPKGIAIGYEGFRDGVVTEKMPKNLKPLFAITEKWIEYKGFRFTLDKLKSLLS